MKLYCCNIEFNEILGVRDFPHGRSWLHAGPSDLITNVIRALVPLDQKDVNRATVVKVI